MNLQIYAMISENFKILIKKVNYENLIFQLLENSKILFPNHYKYITSQSHGECDYIDLKTQEKYDAKLPITTKQGNLIGSDNSNFEKWIESMINECSEYTEKRIKQRELQHNIEELKLHKIIKEALKKDKEDENIIFFFPYPVVIESSKCIHEQFALDILSSIFNDLNEDGIIGNRKIYAIYPTVDNKICIRLLNNCVREWLSTELLDNYIHYNFSLINTKQ